MRKESDANVVDIKGIKQGIVLYEDINSKTETTTCQQELESLGK